MTELVIDVPENEWLTSNMRFTHWAQKTRRIKALRQRAFFLARSQGLIVPTPTLVVAEIGYPRGGRADPSNASDVVKPCLDGITDAGGWPDDDSRHVVGVLYQRGPKTGERGVHRVHFKFIDQHVAF